MNKTTKIIVGIVIIVIIIVLVIVLSAEKKEEGVIKIGAILPLTGKISYIGQDNLIGLKMAQRTINKDGGINGKKLELVIEDSQGDPKIGATAVQKLIAVDKVISLISTTTGISDAVAPIAEENKKVLIYESTNHEIAKGKEYVFSTFPSAYNFCKEASRVALLNGKKRLGILTYHLSSGEECKEGVEEIIKNFPESSIMLSETYNLGDKDFKTILSKFKESKIDSLLIYTYDTEFPTIYKQMIELNIQFPLVCPYKGDTCYGSKEGIELAKENNLLEGAVGSDVIIDKESNFAKEIYEKYGRWPVSHEIYIYSDLLLLARAMNYCDINENLTSSCVKDYLLSNEFDSIVGKTKFDNEGIANRSVVILKWNGSNWVTIK